MTEPDDRILASRELFSEVDLPDDEGPAAFYLTGMTHDELEVTPPTALRWLSQLTPASVADLLCAISASEGWGYELLALRYGRCAASWLSRNTLTSEAAAARVAELLSTEESEKWYARLDRLQLETGIRGAERAGRYDLAKERLDVARQRHPEHAIVLIDEFKHIDGAIGEDLRNPTSAVCRLQELHRRLK
jgi:hypothetical protein